jgi:hypothetical protein
VARDVAEAARKDSGVTGLLVLEDPQLRVAIALERAVPVEMVGLEVEEDRDAGSQLVDVFELEARQLADDPVVFAELPVQLRERAADVAGHGRLEHRPEQLAGRRLAVRAGDADQPGGQEPVAELDLTPDRDLARASTRHERGISRYARALDDEFDIIE